MHKRTSYVTGTVTYGRVSRSDVMLQFYLRFKPQMNFTEILLFFVVNLVPYRNRKLIDRGNKIGKLIARIRVSDLHPFHADLDPGS